MKLVAIGTGAMGLVAAYCGVRRGFDVEVLEAGDREAQPMASSTVT